MARLSVIALSEAFGEFWNALAKDLDVTIDSSGAPDAVSPGPDTAAVILAAGGLERDAIRWLEQHRSPPGLPLLVVGTDTGRRTAMQLVARGASDYFALPDDLEIFRNALIARLKEVLARPADASPDFGQPFSAIAGESPAIQAVLARAARLLAHRNAHALILGETGTGKELLARAIHAGGPRRHAPFVAVNCSALPEHLVESELFGHERGAFTNAHAAKPGLFEVADTGTLFLDEIGDLPLEAQAKLLRVVEDKEVRRIGGTAARKVDLRILAATDDRLPERVRDGRFREDLFFRLSSVVLRLPPLRERGDDLFVIARALLQRLSAEHSLPVPTLLPDLCRQLRAHRWPGNVRELKNALERALLLSSPGELRADELLPNLVLPELWEAPIPFPAALDAITTAAARATMQLCGGNQTESARQLRISPKRLRRLLHDREVVGHGRAAP